MKKILHVIESMDAGGMETMIMNYYRNIDKDKYRFDFMIMKSSKCFFEDEINMLGGKIYRFPHATKHRIANHIQVKKFLKTNKYDIIHCHQGITYYAPLKYAKHFNIKKRIIHSHGIDGMFLKYLGLYNNLWAKKRICSLATNYIACSKLIINDLFTKEIVKNNKYIILPNAIDVEKYKFSIADRAIIRKEFSLKKTDIVFIHIGSFRYQKNHDFLLNVFKKIANNKNNKLILVGDGELRTDIEQYIKVNKLSDQIILTGNRKDVNSLLSAADIMLFPSRWEGLPLTLVEAQASGIPIIASNKISDEAILTSLIKMIPIDNHNTWVKEIAKTKLLSSKERILYNSKMLKSEYNIKVAVKKLEKIYDSGEDI